ncbi:MAG: hypothetical protein U0350_16240 [Caldilineaceae bacterium]
MTYVITNNCNVLLRFAANSLTDDKEGVIPHAALAAAGREPDAGQARLRHDGGHVCEYGNRALRQ